jgi:hypothetical protein
MCVLNYFILNKLNNLAIIGIQMQLKSRILNIFSLKISYMLLLIQQVNRITKIQISL